MTSSNIKFSDTRCSNITSDNEIYWQGCRDENCDDRDFCNDEAKKLVKNSNISSKDHLRHLDKTICYAETYIKYLFKLNELIDKKIKLYDTKIIY